MSFFAACLPQLMAAVAGFPDLQSFLFHTKVTLNIIATRAKIGFPYRTNRNWCVILVEICMNVGTRLSYKLFIDDERFPIANDWESLVRPMKQLRSL